MKHCPFCGDTSPEMISGSCAFTSENYFMAQVSCTHCAAKGPRYCGEEALEDAETKAKNEWNRRLK